MTIDMIIIIVVLYFFIKIFHNIGIRSSDFLIAIPALILWFLIDYWVEIIIIAILIEIFINYINSENEKHLTADDRDAIEEMEGIININKELLGILQHENKQKNLKEIERLEEEIKFQENKINSIIDESKNNN